MRSLLATAALLLALAGLAPPAAATPSRLFGTVELGGAAVEPLPKWQALLERAAAEAPSYEACLAGKGCPSPAAATWLRLLARLAHEPRAEQIRAVNDFLNAFPYRSDLGNYARTDYWATPLEFLRHSGDCEDYAFAKYVSLRRLGFPASALRLVVVEDTLRGMAHAVLVARDRNAWYVLDNLNPDVLPERKVTHYQPYYSVNEAGRWAYAPSDALVVTSGRP